MNRNLPRHRYSLLRSLGFALTACPGSGRAQRVSTRGQCDKHLKYHENHRGAACWERVVRRWRARLRMASSGGGRTVWGTQPRAHDRGARRGEPGPTVRFAGAWRRKARDTGRPGHVPHAAVIQVHSFPVAQRRGRARPPLIPFPFDQFGRQGREKPLAGRRDWSALQSSGS